MTVLLKERGAPKAWRINLRTLEIMDLNPPKRDLPKEFLQKIEENIVEIRKKWNETYPGNVVETEEEEVGVEQEKKEEE